MKRSLIMSKDRNTETLDKKELRVTHKHVT